MSSLVGRESELRAVETFLHAERPGAIAIVGAPGIGKTTLWQAAVEHARARGARLPHTETIDPVALAPAEEAGLVRVEEDGRIEFVHLLFASAVYSAAPTARLVGLRTTKQDDLAVLTPTPRDGS